MLLLFPQNPDVVTVLCYSFNIHLPLKLTVVTHDWLVFGTFLLICAFRFFSTKVAYYLYNKIKSFTMRKDFLILSVPFILEFHISLIRCIIVIFLLSLSGVFM